MKLVFSRRRENLKRIAEDDFKRKLLIGKWIQWRGILLWASLPFIVFLIALTSCLIVYSFSLRNDKSEAILFLKSMDIVLVFGGALVFISFVSLYLVMDTDRSLRRLSAFRFDDTLPTAPTATTALPAEAKVELPEEVMLPPAPDTREDRDYAIEEEFELGAPTPS